MHSCPATPRDECTVQTAVTSDAVLTGPHLRRQAYFWPGLVRKSAPAEAVNPQVNRHAAVTNAQP